jgi:asparagine synthase (glutamine-hydrolysing)
MCGLAGYLSSSLGATRWAADRALETMLNAIVHRGPDDSGIWIDSVGGYSVGHRRLSIVDLSAAGHQPMASTSGRYILAYNGEIYNHEDLRVELDCDGVRQWRGRSDTEVLLAAIEKWGLKASLEKCNGMFALALWDRDSKRLSLARDRLGEKPLYYGWQGAGIQRSFLFGSELKALRLHPSFEGEIDRGALALYFRHSYVPAPHSIYKGISKVLPGQIVTVDGNHQNELKAESFWSLCDVARTGQNNSFSGSPEAAVETLASLLTDAIGKQMMADVPLGAFLSGGIDSSTIVALMQLQSAKPVKTFTIGFSDEQFDEATHARAVAAHLQTDHHELHVDPKTARDIIPLLPEMFCEPFADPSQIPTYLVSRLAREHVTVSLSGDAGDELFGGYNRYQMTATYWKWLSQIPSPLRQMAGKAITSLSPSSWDRLGGTFAAERFRAFGDKMHKAADVLGSQSAADVYYNLVSTGAEPDLWVKEAREPNTFLTGNRPAFGSMGDVHVMMALDGLTYLPDDILTKVDRAAMATSLESRVPFLDHRVVEFAWSLPIGHKIRDGITKWPLRQVLYRHVPQELVDRPKMGFGIPIVDWLRGPLRSWAEELLDERRLRDEGYWHVQPVRQAWAEHQSGKRNWSPRLWSVLMFQAWLQATKTNSKSP